MSTEDVVGLEDFDEWLATHADDRASPQGISQLKEEEQQLEQRKEILPNRDDRSEESDLDVDPSQMSLEQLEKAQKIFLRRLKREDLKDGKCLDQGERLEPKDRSQMRRKNMKRQRAVSNRTTALQRLQYERLQKLAKKTKNDRYEDSSWDRGKLSKKVDRLAEVAKVRLKASEIYSDSSSDSWSSSETDTDQKRETMQGPKGTLLSTLDQLNKVVLTRSQLTSFVDKPIFEQTVIDCFIHMPSSNLRSSIYQIVGVARSAGTYQLGHKTTDHKLRLRHGRLERSTRLDAVSNSPVGPVAFQNWLERCEKDNWTLPELSLLTKKQQDIKKATNYIFTEDDVADIVKKKRAAGKSQVKGAVRKIRLIEERDLALANNDHEKVARLDNEIMEIDQDQDKARFGHSQQKGLRFGGSLRSGLTPYVPKNPVKKTEKRREAALVPAIPQRRISTEPSTGAARPEQTALPSGEPRPKGFPAAEAPQNQQFLQNVDKAKAPLRKGRSAAPRRPMPLPAKRCIPVSAPKPQDVDLERYVKRKYKKSIPGKRCRESDDEVPRVVAPQESRKNKAASLYELHDFHVDIDTSVLGTFDSNPFGKQAARPALA